MPKTCFKCGYRKPVAEFYHHPRMADGRLNKCKVCTKSDVSLNYRAKRRQYAEYERKRFQDPARKKQIAEYHRAARAKYPEKFRAYNKIRWALKSGKITRRFCEVCGSKKSQAHHEDYSKPLDVRWLCFRHHREAHGQAVI